MSTIGVSIPIPPPYGSSLTAARRAAGDPLADAVPPHITLLPPTAVPPQAMNEFTDHLEAVGAGHAPFTVRLRGTGTFCPVSPVVFVAVAQGIADCEALQAAVRSGAVQRDLDFPYHPHVTIAHRVADERLDAAFESMAGFSADFEVAGFDLYQQGDDGTWESIRSFPFRG